MKNAGVIADLGIFADFWCANVPLLVQKVRSFQGKNSHSSYKIAGLCEEQINLPRNPTIDKKIDEVRAPFV